MNASQWERAREIFDSALDLPSDSRPEFLLQACHGDSVLRIKVDELLRASVAADSSSFLNSKWLDDARPAELGFALQSGDILCDRYRIIRPLGIGGMGCVYQAYDELENAQVALKTLLPEIAANPEVLKRFRREVRIAHRITHPNVCRTHYLGYDLRSGSEPVTLWFLTMEYLDGKTLQQVLKDDGALPLPRAFSIARQIADAIQAAHQIGVIHRDIKPSNIMICPASPGNPLDLRVVITDFGLAMFSAGKGDNEPSSITHAGRPMGAIAYISPEQLQGQKVALTTDIYAFGIVLFEMVTGAKAFTPPYTFTAYTRRITQPPPSPKALVPALPVEWESAILRCLQIDPVERFQSVAEVIAVLDGTARSPSRSIWHATLALSPRTRKIFILAAWLAILAVLCWIGLHYVRGRGSVATRQGAFY